MKISVVGLGKLGAVMAAVFAKRGFDVLGVDINESTIKALKDGECPIQETGLEELLKEVSDNIEFSSEYDKVSETDATFIIVPTPSGSDNRFMNEYVSSALEDVCAAIKGNSKYHLLVVVSTVMPGSMQKEFKPIVERYGRVVGEDVGICYNPEFIALGSVINDMLYPDAILIGESDTFAGNMLEGIYDRVCGVEVPIRRMSWYNAEVAKLMLNVCITTKISLANTIAEVCEKIPTGDVDKVTDFLGLDSRIGKKYLKGGLGFGGPCFVRDQRAFKRVAEEFKTFSPIPEAIDEFNELHRSFIINRVCDALEDTMNSTVAILGVTYKPNSPVVEESESIKIAEILQNKYSSNIKIYDPAGMPNAKEVLGNVFYSDNVLGAIKDADICIIATPWMEFANLKTEDFIKHMKTPRVYDCWRIFDREEMIDAGVDYHALGVSDET